MKKVYILILLFFISTLGNSLSILIDVFNFNKKDKHIKLNEKIAAEKDINYTLTNVYWTNILKNEGLGILVKAEKRNTQNTKDSENHENNDIENLEKPTRDPSSVIIKEDLIAKEGEIFLVIVVDMIINNSDKNSEKATNNNDNKSIIIYNNKDKYDVAYVAFLMNWEELLSMAFKKALPDSNTSTPETVEIKAKFHYIFELPAFMEKDKKSLEFNYEISGNKYKYKVR